MADTEETVEETAEQTQEEVQEERARIDEVTHDDDTRVLDAITSLGEKLDGLRDMMSAFVDAGGVISEGEPVAFDDTPDEDDVIVYDDDKEDVIDYEVVKDLSNIEFDK